MDEPRYFVEEGSNTGHCCFAASVLDRNQPTPHEGEPRYYYAICECMEREEADLICSAMNAIEKK
jgi:hypothetical protein